MQPAVAEVVQNCTVPASTATAGACLSARMSFPWCGPPARGAPKSSLYVTEPTTGKISFGTALPDDAAALAVNESVAIRRKRMRSGERKVETLADFSKLGFHRDEDCRVRQAGARSASEADRSVDAPARPLG